MSETGGGVLILDGACGAGGATRGYVQAGHLVYGIDSDPRMEKNYLKSGAAGFLCADICEALAAPWISKVDAIHVSPPCQFYSAMAACRAWPRDTRISSPQFASS
jgi:site-specific DNA-cytosine methylase